MCFYGKSAKDSNYIYSKKAGYIYENTHVRFDEQSITLPQKSAQYEIKNRNYSCVKTADLKIRKILRIQRGDFPITEKCVYYNALKITYEIETITTPFAILQGIKSGTSIRCMIFIPIDCIWTPVASVFENKSDDILRSKSRAVFL
ncbi:hypothetical protein GCM10022209_34710 [Chitinophaga oryziterrae]